MPSVSERQRRWAGAQFARKRKGRASVAMSEEQLRDFARGKKKRKLLKREAY